jgi:DNA-directed RNA polymerase specialized sigma24 family protein
VKRSWRESRTDEDWKTCFAQLGPALLLFARRWTNCRADAEGRGAGSVRSLLETRTFDPEPPLLYAAVRSAALDRLRERTRRARREAAVARDGAEHAEPEFVDLDEGQKMLAAAWRVCLTNNGRSLL